MLRIKRLAAIMVLALVTSLGAPQAFAGDMGTPGITGDIQAPGFTGDMHTPSLNGEVQTPGLNGDIGMPGLNGEMPGAGFWDGWMGTGLAAIASFFG